MPSAPTLSGSITVGNTGHVADHNVIAPIIDAIYLGTPVTAKTVAFMLTAANSGEFIPVNVSSTVAVTVPSLAAGTSVELYWLGSAGFTLTASGVTLECPGTAAPRIQFSVINLFWRDATHVVVGGDHT